MTIFCFIFFVTLINSCKQRKVYRTFLQVLPLPAISRYRIKYIQRKVWVICLEKIIPVSHSVFLKLENTRFQMPSYKQIHFHPSKPQRMSFVLGTIYQSQSHAMFRLKINSQTSTLLIFVIERQKSWAIPNQLLDLISRRISFDQFYWLDMIMVTLYGIVAQRNLVNEEEEKEATFFHVNSVLTSARSTRW